MKQNTVLTQDIQLSEGKSAYDSHCLRLLSNTAILSRIVSALVGEFKDIPVHEIAEKYLDTPHLRAVPVFPDETNANRRVRGISNEDKLGTEGKRDYDILFNAAANAAEEVIKLIINLEAQNKQNPGYPILKCAIYQGSRLISAQYGVEFLGSDFKNLKKVYSIWILPSPNRSEQNTIEKYNMVRNVLCGARNEPVQNYDLMTIIIVYLGDPQKSSEVEILHLLSVLLSNELAAEEKLKTLETKFGISITYEIKEEVINMCNLSDAIEQRGIEKGIEKGIDIQAKIVEGFMRKLNIPLEEALEIPGLSDKEKNAIRLRLQ